MNRKLMIADIARDIMISENKETISRYTRSLIWKVYLESVARKVMVNTHSDFDNISERVLSGLNRSSLFKQELGGNIIIYRLLK